MVTIESVLSQVAAGKTSFAPASKSNGDIEAFQETAKALERAHEQGYLDGYFSHKESYTGHGWYVLAAARNGLSYKGQACLRSSIEAAPAPPQEIVQLKPSFHGVSVDLKALWRRVWKRT